jgi:catechol 2,3-dioxygenase-like lactoylglutathione lyase family enzyme
MRDKGAFAIYSMGERSPACQLGTLTDRAAGNKAILRGSDKMTNPRVIGVRSVELGVRDLAASVRFYRDAWGLAEVSAEADAVHLRGTGIEHHVLTLREAPQAQLIAVHMAARDRAAVDALAQRAEGFGAAVNDLGELPAQAGGGFGFRFKTPDGLPMSISADVG